MIKINKYLKNKIQTMKKINTPRKLNPNSKHIVHIWIKLEMNTLNMLKNWRKNQNLPNSNEYGWPNSWNNRKGENIDKKLLK